MKSDHSTRCLIVEDDMGILKLLTMWCEELGFTVESAPDFHTAYRLALTNEYDVYILDYRLDNGFTGVQICEALDLTSRGQVIFVTAYGKETKDMHIYPRYASVPVLQKPFAFEQFSALLADKQAAG